MASSSALKRWLRPEVYPLFAAVGVAIGICGMQLVRSICTNPEVRVTKEHRAAGILENFKEGETLVLYSLGSEFLFLVVQKNQNPILQLALPRRSPLEFPNQCREQ